MDRSERKAFEEQVARLTSEFFNASRNAKIYKRDHIARLAELATSDDRDAATLTSEYIFKSLVEPMADSFDENSVRMYNRLFAQLIQFCRGTAAGRELHKELLGFGLATEDDIARRGDALPSISPVEEYRLRRVKRLIVLSRVTLGADIAVTSVLIGRLKQVFPDANVTLVGSRKTAELFGGNSGVSIHETNYRRSGSLNERLASWIDVLTSVRVLSQSFKPGEVLVVDPDTRLTQLGLLPVSTLEQAGSSRPSGELLQIKPDQYSTGYLFFPSREYGSGTSHPLSRLASMWMTEVFGMGEACFPRIEIAPAQLEPAQSVVNLLRRTNSGPIAAINFGVGENESKRVGDEFEEAVIGSLLQNGFRIILDKGMGPAEAARADRLITGAIRSMPGTRIVDAMEGTLKRIASSDSLDAGILVWQGRIGVLAGLISASDLYVGYDSAGQHIAAALGVPCIDVFAGAPSSRFIERWKPTGPATTHILHVTPGSSPGTIVEEVMRKAGYR